MFFIRLKQFSSSLSSLNEVVQGTEKLKGMYAMLMDDSWPQKDSKWTAQTDRV